MSLIENWQIRIGLVCCSCILIVQITRLYFVIQVYVCLQCISIFTIR